MRGLVPRIHVLFDRHMAGGFVYIVTNRPNGILYVGVTSNLPRRAHEHRAGLIDGFSRRYGLRQLVWYERHDDTPRRGRSWKPLIPLGRSTISILQGPQSESA